MKFFKSLNCCLCKSPFVPIANQPKSPRYLGCGKTACHECFETEKALKVEERRHKCSSDNCFYNPHFAYSMIEILSSSSLVQVPLQTGYLLAENFDIPECPICHEEFTIEGPKRPYFLYCLHDICKDCFEKCRKPYEGPRKDEYSFKITCSKCDSGTLRNEGHWHDPRITKFLEELPEMTRQLGEMKDSKFRFCSDCKSLDPIERMFHCHECKKKICGVCALQEHRFHGHVVITLIEHEALELSNTIQDTSLNEIAAYQNVFPVLHSELSSNIQDFQVKLVAKEETLSRKRNFEDLQASYKKCNRLKSDFETLSEEYMPNLRKYNAGLEGLIKELRKEPS